MAMMHVTLMVKFSIYFGSITEFLLFLPHLHTGLRQHDTQHQYSQARAPSPGHEVVMLSGLRRDIRVMLTHQRIRCEALARRVAC